MEEPDHFCCWEGFNSSHKALRCVNDKISHPWKTFIDVCGNEERAKTDYCQYHQKFCIDESRRHPNSIIRITCPNKHALCTECFVLREGKHPPFLERIPGLKRTEKNKKNVTDATRCTKKERHYITSNKHLEYQACVTDESDDREQQRNVWVNVVSAKIIQSRWRRYKTDVKKELEEYETYNLRNTAAVKIQVHFRHSLLKSKVKRANISININSLPVHENESNLMRKRSTSMSQVSCQCITTKDIAQDNNEDIFHLMIDRKSSSKRITGQSDNSSSDCLGERLNVATSIKCTLTACRLCNKFEDTPPRRRHILSNDFFHKKELLMNTRKLIVDDSPFRSIDPFQLGSIPKRKFQNIIKKVWNVAGHPLLPGELDSIVSEFDCHNGHINYEDYIHFANQQMIPCPVHSRLVCTSPLCNSLSEKGTHSTTPCQNFSPRQPNSKLCICGKYITHHTMTPKQRKNETRKRGLNIYSTEDMKRTFSRKTAPDVDIDVQFKNLKYCPSVNQREITMPFNVSFLSIFIKISYHVLVQHKMPCSL